MSIRIAQQYIQYVADPNTESDLRVTQLYAQVAVKVGAVTIVKVATNSIFDEADSNLAEQAGTFRYAGCSNTMFDFYSDNSAEYDPLLVLDISQGLFTSQSLTSNYYVASSTIFGNASDSLAGRDYAEDVVQYLGFTDRYFDQLGNYFGFDDHVGQETVEAVSNGIFADPSTDNLVIQAWNGVNSLGFSATVGNDFPYKFLQEFGFAQTVASTGPVARGPGQSMLKQSLGFTINDNACREKQYAPMIGEGSDGFPELAAAAPTITTGTLTLRYPVESPTLTLTLENPEFGNKDTLSFTRLDRDTRGGDRKIFSDPKWARWERLEFEVKDLCEVDADEILTFLNTTLGAEIGLADWENRDWTGFIVTPETDIVKEVGGWSLSLTFEGGLTPLSIQHGGDAVIHGQDSDGNDIEVEHE